MHVRKMVTSTNSSMDSSLEYIASNNRKTGVNVVALVNRFLTSSVKCWTVIFCIYANKNPVIVMNQLKSIYNSPFKDSHSRPIRTCFPMIASNGFN